MNYDLPITPPLDGKLAFNADFYHIDEYYAGEALLPAYNNVDVNLHWSNIADKPMDLTLFMTNAFDKLRVSYLSVSSNSFGVYAGGYAPPRMYGVRLRYRFDD
ncbi:hypothetical protein BH10PSE12_BH10PSE12_01690 [soil metagenome]